MSRRKLGPRPADHPRRGRWGGSAAAGAVALWWLGACGLPAADPAGGALGVAGTKDAVFEVPADGSGFLARLLPSAAERVLVVHRVEGRAGITGTLEILVRRGGFRRENWRIHVPVDGAAPVERAVTTIVTPAGVETHTADGEILAFRLPFAALARAYERAPVRLRRKVIAAVERYHAELAEARRRHPGNRQTVAGQGCLFLRVAAQTLCLWEEAGLPLRYRGPLLSSDAVRIDRAPAFAADAFAVTADLAGAPAAEGFSDVLDMEPDAVLARIAEGDPAVLSRLSVPGVRPPVGVTGGGGP